jgi:ribonuclease HI
MSYTLYFDGCSKGNPGKAGAGSVMYKDGAEIWAKSEYLDNQTNNYAEYMGLINGLKYATSNDISKLTVYGDSMLIIKQMRGEYAVKSTNLMKLHSEAKNLKMSFKEVEFLHVYRDGNKRADELANMGLKNN